MGETYIVDTIANMAKLAPDVRSRFLAELPDMLEALAPLVAVGATLAGVTWTDDGVREGRVNVRVVQKALGDEG